MNDVLDKISRTPLESVQRIDVVDTCQKCKRTFTVEHASTKMPYPKLGRKATVWCVHCDEKTEWIVTKITPSKNQDGRYT